MFLSNHVQTIELVTGGLQSSCSDDQRKLNAPELNLEKSGMNTYVNEIFLYFIFNKLANISKNTFSLCHYGLLCVDW